MFFPEIIHDDDDADIIRVTRPADPDPAENCAADLDSLSRLVDRIRDVRAAFQAACDTFDMETLALWVSGAPDEDVRLFQLMLDLNTRYQLQEMARAQSARAQSKGKEASGR